MEYVEGDALSRTLSRVGRLTPARTMALVAQAADALHAAHEKGIVHRDVKPGNLLVRPNGTLVLTDFGIARSDAGRPAHRGRLGARHRLVHLARSRPPARSPRPPSDVYALGVVAYQCLAGRRPFEGDNPLEIAMRHVRETPRPLPADIPPQVRAIVERAMAKDPAARWPSAAALAGGGPPGSRPRSSQQARAGRRMPGRSPAAPASPAAPSAAPRCRRPQQLRPPAARTARRPPAPRPAGAAQRPTAGRTGRAALPAAGRPGRLAARGRGGAAGPAATTPGVRPAGRPGAAATAARRSRPGMVLLAILLAVLVLLCSGVISYNLRQAVAVR